LEPARHRAGEGCPAVEEIERPEGRPSPRRAKKLIIQIAGFGNEECFSREGADVSPVTFRFGRGPSSAASVC